MQTYQHQFIEFCLQHEIITFGQFTLKSGRISPYFFNAGLFNTGECLAKVGGFYAEAIHQANLDLTMLFGPAYKGIPLVCATAIALNNAFHQNYSYAFNRKEAKDHGEGGNLVGANLMGKVLIIDDVISAGTAFRQSLELTQQANATVAGLVIALDRQERGENHQSAIDEIKQQYSIPVISIITLDDILQYTKQHAEFTAHHQAIMDYRQQYGVAT